MGTVGTFDAFTTARLGIYAAYKGLSVTGNNISNINTEGYTRQVVDQVSLKTGANDMYRSQYDNHIGNGALVTGISQIRDPYLDIRFRNTSADVSYYDETLSGLQQIASILDEVGKGENKGDGMLYAQLQNLAESLRAISADPTKDSDTLARTSADALVGLFNKYADKLENLRLDFEDSLNQDIKMANDILTNIRNLNESIRESDVHGDPALEMRDERNRQIDELSKYMHIKVTYTMEDIGGGLEVERCTIALANDNPDPTVKSDSSILVDGIYGAQIAIPENLPVGNPNYDLAAAGRNKDKMAAEGFDINDPADFATLEPNGFMYVKAGAVKNPDYDPAAAEANKALMETPGFDPIATPLDPNGFMYVKADADGNPTTDEAEYTDNPDEALTDPNDNYTVTVSKLLDAGGEEWTKPTTTWAAVDDGVVGVKAKYTYTLDSTTGWKAGDTITIGNKTFTIGGTKTTEVPAVGNPGDPDYKPATVTKDKIDGDIKAYEANNPETMAAFIAEKLSGQPGYEDYIVRANTRNDGAITVIFTAKNSGVVGGGNGPAAEPVEPAITGSGTGKVEFGAGGPDEVRPGVDRVPPNDPDYPGGTTWNADGSETKISFVESDSGWAKCTVVVEHTYDVTLDDNDLHGSLQATRELLTESGEFATTEYINGVDESAAIKRGIPYYQKSFDLLARQFAEQYNKLNQGFMVNEKGNYIAEDGSELELAGASISKTNGLTADQKQALIDGDCVVEGETDKDGNPIPDLNRWLQAKADDDTIDAEKKPKIPEGTGVLFSNRGDNNDPSNITAANISISAGWSSGSVKIVPTMVELFGKDPQYEYDEDGNVKLDEDGKPVPNTTQNENVNHMLTMINESLLYDPRTLVEGANGTKLFQGSFNDMFSNMNIVLGNDQLKTSVKLNSQYTALTEIDTGREGVSGVDLNDEAMNMMQYQKAYSAACRIMTAIDEVLDRLINNTGVAGR